MDAGLKSTPSLTFVGLYPPSSLFVSNETLEKLARAHRYSHQSSSSSTTRHMLSIFRRTKSFREFNSIIQRNCCGTSGKGRGVYGRGVRNMWCINVWGATVLICAACENRCLLISSVFIIIIVTIFSAYFWQWPWPIVDFPNRIGETNAKTFINCLTNACGGSLGP